MTKTLDDLDIETRKYGAGNTGIFEFKRGQNKMRILTFPEVLATHFFGVGVSSITCIGVDEGCPYHKDTDKRPSLKLVSYIIDRADDNKIKLAELPLSIRYALKDLMEDEDYTFDDFPMPYDVKITSDPDNTDPKAKYRLVGSPKREEITEDEQKELDEKLHEITPEQYVEKKKAKARANNYSDVETTQKAVSGFGVRQDTIPQTEESHPEDIPF